MLFLFAILASFFFLAERLFPLHRQPVLRTGLSADVFYIPLHYFMRVFVNGTFAVLLTGTGGRFLPPSLFAVMTHQPLWVQVLSVLFILDFIFYITHRAKHRWRWWWRLHETHHSSTEMDFLSSTRFHPFEKLIDRILYVFPLLFLGISETAVFIWAAVDVFLGMLNHSNLNWRIGPLIYIFVGPEMHRWHHVKDPAIRECNYGNNFSIFDWVFKTAYLSYDKPGEYGLEDGRYPQNNVFKQFLYAFRPHSSHTLRTPPSEERERMPEDQDVLTPVS